MSRRAAALAATLGAVATLIALPAVPDPADASSVTTTLPATLPATPPISPPVVTEAPTTIPAPTTIAGPIPRASRRVASPVAIEKIRATSLPLRTMGITLGVAVAALAAVGFVYGKIRSRIPAVAIPKVAVSAGPDPSGPLPAPSATSMPPPAIPLPPPIIEDAVSDTVIFEPPPEHRTPPVFAETTDETPATLEPQDEPADSEASDDEDDGDAKDPER